MPLYEWKNTIHHVSPKIVVVQRFDSQDKSRNSLRLENYSQCFLWLENKPRNYRRTGYIIIIIIIIITTTTTTTTTTIIKLKK